MAGSSSSWGSYLLGSGYSLSQGGPKKERTTSEEFMFGSEPIIGYRLWAVGKLNYDSLPDFLGLLADAHDAGASNPYRWAHTKTQQTLLRPIAQQGGGAWLPGVTEARCTASDHKAPNLQCECGFWALRDEQQLVAAFDSYQPTAWGTVRMWGRFCEFEKGYRAQYAYPEKITLLNGDDHLAYDLAGLYGCEVGVGGVPEAVTVARAEREEAAKSAQGALTSYSAMMIDLQKQQHSRSLSNHLNSHLLLSELGRRKKWWQR